MAKFCGSCGGSLRSGAKFCAACGAALPVVMQSGRSEHSDQSSMTGQRPERPVLVAAIVVGGILSLALVGNAAGWFGNSQSAVEEQVAAEQLLANNSGPLPKSWFVEYSDDFLSDPVTQFVTGPAQKRNYPTSRGTNVIATLQQGNQIEGRWVKGADPSSKWLRTSDGGYVWEGNLAQALARNSPGQFPSQLRGTWGLRDDCNGADMDMTVTISSNSISFYESRGDLVGTSMDATGYPVYRLSMSGEGQTWAASYTITPSVDGRSILLRDISRRDDPEIWYFDVGLPCDQLVRN